tara:strand:+ start:2267 stop:2713 length:447 start_codon:yes stop_codon:yes gene_type:complete
MKRRIAVLAFAMLFVSQGVFADSGSALSEQIVGVWRMDPRTLNSFAVSSYQEDGTVTFKLLPDGRFSVIGRISTRMVLKNDQTFTDPGCVGEKECTQDGATEGLGALFGNTIYVDWFDAGWIDDFFKVNGNVMTGDDGNGLIRLVKEE